MIKIIVNSERSKLENCPNEIAKEINSLCSYRIENFQFSDAYISGHWDGYVRKFSLKKRTFPSGLFVRIAEFLKRKELKFEINDLRKKLVFQEDEVVRNLESFKFVLRPYQIEGLITSLKVPNMIFWWATSSGKTVQFSALISALKKEDFRRTLILVANKDLAAQHRKEVSSMLDAEIGVIEEGKFNPKRVTVAVINTLWIKAIKNKDPSVLKYLAGIEHLIIDEVHRAIDSKMFKQTIGKCKNTVARHGFSGSPFSLTVDDLELESVTGPPLSKVTMSKLISEGWVSRPEITIFDYSSPWIHSTSYSSVYKEGITLNEKRNKIIAEVAASEFSDTNNSILIIVRIIRHGKLLQDLLLEEGISFSEIDFVHGSTPMSARIQVKERLKEKSRRLVIASQIWNEGIDIPTIDVLIKADGGGGASPSEGKGIRSVIQQVGRVIRKPVLEGEVDVLSSQENRVKIYDFFDNNHYDLRKHSGNRYITYKMEPEFIVRRVDYESWKSARDS